jgi:hypothetical protein
MRKETKAQKATRVGMLLADLDARTRELNKLTATVKDLKEQVRAEGPGTYGDWTYTAGTPREILDQKAAKNLLTEAGIVVPKQMTEAPIVITNKAAS